LAAKQKYAFEGSLMKLHVTRSQAAKSKFFGGSETIYELRLRAELSEEEAGLLKKYGHENHHFEYPEEFYQLTADKELQAPPGLSLQNLQRGVELGCKFLATPFSSLPQAIIEEYRHLWASLHAREEWGGEETLSSDD
jgi:hypothetical protein